MRRIVFALSFVVLTLASSFAGVTVSSPGSGSSMQSPVHFVASATTSCASGVAAMGIYTAPNLLTYVVQGAKLDTSLSLATGSYHTVVQSWDHCGGASSTPIALTVTGGNVQVSSPANNATISGPVHFLASASSSCARGIAAMGIYTAPFKLAYQAAGTSLDKSLILAPGTYNAVVQEWDNCGASATRPITFTVAASTQSAVHVTTPMPNATVSSPVHYVASATTTCSGGVSAMGVYVNNQLMTSSNGATLDTNLALASGKQNTVVQSWDNCGGSAKTPLAVNVNSSTAKTFFALQKSTNWNSYGELAPVYDICTNCSPQITWSTKQGVSSPSLSGSAMATNIGGTIPYSDALWNNHLVGDFSSQGLPDPNQTLSASLHNFIYDVYFYGTDLEAAQSLEFDVNQFVKGRSYIWGHECRVAGGHVWAVWDNPNNRWISTGIACNPLSNSWNHLVIQVQRTSDNQLLYQTITLNGVTNTLNWYNPSTPTIWNGITINYQLDGNFKQQPYTVYLDNLNFSYF